MKKFKEEGRILSRKEMKAVTGGYAECLPGGVCEFPCGHFPDQTQGWFCYSVNNTCRPYSCDF